MRIATWNVNSLKARLEKVTWWLERAQPDVLLIQETKLADADTEAARAALAKHGYEMAHHGQGRWNGVAILSRTPMTDVVANFGAPLAGVADAGDDHPLREARMLAATTGGIRVVTVYAPNGRELASPFYAAKLEWFDRLTRWLVESAKPSDALVLAGDLNIAPHDIDVWDAAACHGGTHVSPRERSAFEALCAWGLVDAYRARHEEAQRYTWWDYRAGMFHKNYGMRIDHILATQSVAARIKDAEIDREARKGTPIPSDHAPLFVDLDTPGHPLDAGWTAAESRIAARRK